MVSWIHRLKVAPVYPIVKMDNGDGVLYYFSNSLRYEEKRLDLLVIFVEIERKFQILDHVMAFLQRAYH